MRLDKLLANMGYGSRKEVKKLLKDGVVKIDGISVKDAKVHVNVEEQEVMIHGEVVEYKEFVYLMMHKPQGVISATEDDNHETVIDLLELEDAIFNPFPVGRLDIDTEGFLLITNDGKLSHQLLSPKKHVPKKYYAHVAGVVTEEDVKEFAKGVILDDGYETKPGALTILKSDDISEIELVITEGKFHQVKRMFEAVGEKSSLLKENRDGTVSVR
ncbi:RNA pseudouridine synthase family protein [Bacillus anthracis str. CDC 684]|nr:RNA pseudouridine synthase family protein [Bacillus anthracis str. CDC 684]